MTSSIELCRRDNFMCIRKLNTFTQSTLFSYIMGAEGSKLLIIFIQTTMS